MNAPFRSNLSTAPGQPRPDASWQTMTGAANMLYAEGRLGAAHALYLAAEYEANQCLTRAQIEGDSASDLCTLAPMMVVISCQNRAQCAEKLGSMAEAEAAHRAACTRMLDIAEGSKLPPLLRAAAVRHLKPALCEYAAWLRTHGRGSAPLAALVARGQRLVDATQARPGPTHH